MKNISMVLFVVASCFFGSFLNAQIIPPTNGLIAYYPFLNGSLNDATGNNHNGLDYGATLTNNQAGLPSDAYCFSGGSYIEITNTSEFPAATNDFSVSMWIEFTQMTTAGSYQMIFCGRSSDSFQLDVNTGNGTNAPLDFFPGQTFNVPPDLTTASVPWILNQWYNVQIIRAQNVLSIFRNTVLIGQTITTNSNDAEGQNIDFGYRLSGTSAPFPLSGTLSDIRFYNRALSSLEVTNLYQAEANNLSIALLPGIIISGVPGSVYDVEYVTNLSNTNWTILATNLTLSGNSLLLADTNALGQPQRFYRVVTP